MTASFAAHSAFRPGGARADQIAALNDIRAVLPRDAAEACRAVWAAMQEIEAVPAALRALERLPKPVRRDVIARAEQIGRTPRRAA